MKNLSIPFVFSGLQEKGLKEKLLTLGLCVIITVSLPAVHFGIDETFAITLDNGIYLL